MTLSFRLPKKKNVTFKNIETIFHGAVSGRRLESPTAGDIIKD